MLCICAKVWFISASFRKTNKTQQIRELYTNSNYTLTRFWGRIRAFAFNNSFLFYARPTNEKQLKSLPGGLRVPQLPVTSQQCPTLPKRVVVSVCPSDRSTRAQQPHTPIIQVYINFPSKSKGKQFGKFVSYFAFSQLRHVPVTRTHRIYTELLQSQESFTSPTKKTYASEIFTDLKIFEVDGWVAACYV